MARYIDADAINFRCFYEGGCSARVSKADCMGCKEYICDATDIKNMPTAYDVEAVIAELEKLSKCGLRCEECINREKEYDCTDVCDRGAFAKAISIVRGKE